MTSIAKTFVDKNPAYKILGWMESDTEISFFVSEIINIHDTVPKTLDGKKVTVYASL